MRDRRFLDRQLDRLKSNAVLSRLAEDQNLNQYILVGWEDAKIIYENLNEMSPNCYTHPLMICEFRECCSGPMANIVEAIIDAIFIDSHPACKLESIDQFVTRHLNSSVEKPIPDTVKLNCSPKGLHMFGTFLRGFI